MIYTIIIHLLFYVYGVGLFFFFIPRHEESANAIGYGNVFVIGYLKIIMSILPLYVLVLLLAQDMLLVNLTFIMAMSTTWVSMFRMHKQFEKRREEEMIIRKLSGQNPSEWL